MVLGALQLVRGQVTGPASENFWNALTTAHLLQNPALAAAFAALGVAQVARGGVLGSASSLLFYAMVTRLLSRAGGGR